MMNRVLLILLFSLTLSNSVAQMPETSIYLISYINNGNQLTFTDVKQISNGIGYNNQPSFTKDCKIIYFTSNVLDSLQTDLFAYDIAKGQSQRLSNVGLSEYSPLIRPGFSKGLTHVRVEDDKKQHLRFYDSTYTSSLNLVPNSDSVGYYVWSDSNNLGLIILNNGLEFHTYRLGDSNTKLISKNVGRLINYDKKTDSYLFLNKDSASYTINYFNIKTGSIQNSFPAMTDCEDYAIDVNSGIYGGYNGKLFRYSNTRWGQIADFSEKVGSFYRLSFCDCGKHLCVVSFNGKRP